MLKSPPRLWLYFMALALISLIIGGILLTRITQQVVQDSLLSAGQYYNQSIGEHLNSRYQSEIEALIAGEDADEIGALVEASLQNTRTLKVKIMGDGRVLYSTDPADIGTDVTANASYLNTQRTRQPISEVKAEHQVETYLPIYNTQGDVIGAMELYSDGVPLENALRPIENDILEAVLIPTIFFLLMMAGLVFFADMRLREQRQLLEQQNSTLMLQLITRAELSYMTVRALQEAFLKVEPAPLEDKRMEQGYNQIEQLAENLSMIEQLERGQLEPHKVPFALDDLLRERASFFKPAEVVIHQKSGIGVIADRAMIAHAIDALLTNLHEYNQHKTKILLSAAPAEDKVKITAALGIPNRDGSQPQPVSVNQKIDLTVARMLAAQHGGTLAFDFGKEEGVQFHLLLPL